MSSSTTYPDGTPQAPAAETYDGLGRVTSYTADNVTATTSYAGAGGLQTGTTLTPTDTSDFPGADITAATGNTMTGALTTKTLTQAANPGQLNSGAAAPAAGTSYTYNAAGQIATATDPAGHTTSYTYTHAGQIATLTQPDGAVTTYTYDPKTGRLAETQIRSASGATQAPPATRITRTPGWSSRSMTRPLPMRRSPTATTPTATSRPCTTPTARPPLPPTTTPGS